MNISRAGKGRWIRAALTGFAIALLVLQGAAMAAEIEGVKVAEKVRVSEGGPELVLNGAGVRTRFFFRVYVGALYVQQKKTSAGAILSDAGAKRVAMHMLRDLTAEQLFSALDDGLKNNKGTVPGAEFNQALIRIWLGDSPADGDLKKAMLGG